jgi:hypothetical protein
MYFSFNLEKEEISYVRIHLTNDFPSFKGENSFV